MQSYLSSANKMNSVKPERSLKDMAMAYLILCCYRTIPCWVAYKEQIYLLLSGEVGGPRLRGLHLEKVCLLYHPMAKCRCRRTRYVQEECGGQIHPFIEIGSCESKLIP